MDSTRLSCNCGLCSIRLDKPTLGHIDPFLFLSFLKQAATIIQTRVGEGVGVTTIHLDLCWMNCRGGLRSLCINTTQRQMAIATQQRTNWAGLIEICHRYVDARRRTVESSKSNSRRESRYTMCRSSIQQASILTLTHGFTSVEQVMSMFRVVEAIDSTS